MLRSSANYRSGGTAPGSSGGRNQCHSYTLATPKCRWQMNLREHSRGPAGRTAGSPQPTRELQADRSFACSRKLRSASLMARLRATRSHQFQPALGRGCAQQLHKLSVSPIAGVQGIRSALAALAHSSIPYAHGDGTGRDHFPSQKFFLGFSSGRTTGLFWVMSIFGLRSIAFARRLGSDSSMAISSCPP